MIETREKIDASQLDLKDTVVNISRVTKVVKGGKNLSSSALKLRFLPPLTTLVTRLMLTTVSFRSSCDASIFSRVSIIRIPALLRAQLQPPRGCARDTESRR